MTPGTILRKFRTLATICRARVLVPSAGPRLILLDGETVLTSGFTTSPRARGRCASCSGQGRERRRDDAGARRRSGAGRVHDHDRGVRRVHARWHRPSPTGLADQVAAGARASGAAAPASGSATAADPLLVSVRSGARESMPGMLDTVLNLGLNDESVLGLAAGDRQRAVRVGLLPAVRADARQRRRAGFRVSGSRTRSPPPRRSAASREDTELDVDALRELTGDVQGDLRRARPARRSRRIRVSS